MVRMHLVPFLDLDLVLVAFLMGFFFRGRGYSLCLVRVLVPDSGVFLSVGIVRWQREWESSKGVYAEGGRRWISGRPANAFIGGLFIY